MHAGGGRRVLEQFDQVIAVDHLARRDGHVAAHGIGALPGRMRAHGGALPVLCHMGHAARQVGAAACEGGLLHHGIGQHEVRRRQHVEPLAHGEGDDVLVVRRDAAHARGGAVPPLLLQQEALVDEVVRPALPGRVLEAPVLRQRGDAGRCAGVAGECGLRGVLLPAADLLPRFLQQGLLFRWRQRQVAEPVGIGIAQRGRGNAARELAQPGVQQQVQGGAFRRALGIVGRGRALPGAALAFMLRDCLLRLAHGDSRCFFTG
eukprot:gene23734-biopygen20289